MEEAGGVFAEAVVAVGMGKERGGQQEALKMRRIRSHLICGSLGILSSYSLYFCSSSGVDALSVF